jgi:carboxyl-terminal processing protease
MEKTRDGKQTSFRDPNRGTIYDGPMALMVNGQSASASEMLAAALQDYNRALVVGSNTFGKATGQQMLLLDTFRLKPYTGAEDRDMVKITMKKLYRLDGHSAQLNGVSPDIALPDAFSGLNITEKTQRFALSADTVKANSVYKPLKALPVPDLARRSADRIMGNKDFQAIKEIIVAQQKLRQTAAQTVPLKWDAFEKWIQQQELELKTMEGESATRKTFAVENHSQDKQLLQNKIVDKGTNDAWLEELAEDIYIQETFLVLADLINLQKTATKN